MEGFLLFLSFFAFVGGAAFGESMANRDWREDAVKRGVAEFYFSRKFKKQFRWLPKPKVTKKGSK